MRHLATQLNDQLLVFNSNGRKLAQTGVSAGAYSAGGGLGFGLNIVTTSGLDRGGGATT